MKATTLALGTFLTCALSTSTTGQVQTTAVQGTVPTVEFDYHLSTGQLVEKGFSNRGSQPAFGGPQLPVADTVCFDNTNPPAFFALIPAGQEFVDWGEKECGGTGWIRTIEVGYGTRALDPAMGGPGAALEFALYRDTVGAIDVLGTELVRFQLSGLPGSADGIGAVAGTALVNLISDGLASTTPILPNGKLGWGYADVDGVTGPLLVDIADSAFVDEAAAPGIPFGYEADAIPADFDDISATGTDIVPIVGGFLAGMNVPVGFDFTLFGTSTTEVGLHTDGMLSLPSLSFGYAPFPICFPPIWLSEAAIYPTMTTLDLDPFGGSLTYQTKGVAPNRVFIAQWTEGNDIYICPTGGLTYQIKLFESTNAIEIHYGTSANQNLCTDASPFDIGVEDPSGSRWLQIGCSGSQPTTPGSAYRITIGAENDNGTVNELNRYTAPASDANFLESIVVTDAMGNDSGRASTYLILIEEDGACATATTLPRFSPNNPSIFLSLTQPKLGSTWTAALSTTGFPNTTATSMSVSLGLGPCGSPGACPTVWGDLLVNPAAFILTQASAPVFGLSVHPVPIPVNAELCGTIVFAQAAIIDPTLSPPIRFTNALDVQLGF